MKKIGVIILSRYNSSRLPGKALIKINNKEILSYIVERVLQVFDKNQIVLATSDEKTDDPIDAYAKRNNLNCYRGSLNNVAQRFFNAAIENDFDYVVRINGDNIFLDINLLKELKEKTIKGSYDFISNVKDRTYPKGMSIEIIRVKYYAKWMGKIQESERYKEHVTLFFYENEANHFYKINTSLEEMKGIQLALDTKEDFERTTSLINLFTEEHWNYNLKEIYQLLKKTNYV
jgi:spore coat polysaccharide biosynthesis protein SpsF (cytidylyltransferase family)